jgi:glycerophosphoryl diester phosphodiesterase
MAPLIIGHRGYSAKAPENTLAAMDLAIEAGVRALEWDVSTPSCGTPVLFHDPHLGRTTNGVGLLKRRTFGQLQTLDAGRWFSPSFEGERVPSLAAALEHVKGRVDRIFSEVKAYRELEDIDRMVKIVSDAGMDDVVTFISLDWKNVDRVRSQNPGVRIGYVVDGTHDYEDALARAVQDGNTLLDLQHTLVLSDPSLASRAREKGIEVAVWTVDDATEADSLRAAGVQGFTTNQVERLLGWASAQV